MPKIVVILCMCIAYNLLEQIQDEKQIFCLNLNVL